MNAGGLGTVVGLLIALPFTMLADWFGWINQQRYPELAKACHGAGMLALLGYAIWLAGGPIDFAAALAMHADNFCWIAPAVIAAWGLGWVLLNARFAAQSVSRPHRATMIVRALLKTAAGYGAWISTQGAEAWWITLLMSLVAVWCMATGAVKFLLMIWRGARGEAYPMVADDIAANEFDWDK